MAKGKGRPDYGFCLVCQTRKARFTNLTCEPCRALVDAEGSHKKYGIVTETKVQQQWKEYAAAYNKLIRKRFTQAQIADMWGWPLQRLRSATHRWKKQGGLKVMPGWVSRAPEGVTLEATNKVRPYVINDHGTGRWGVRGCKCDPCRATRAATRADLVAKKAERDKQVKPS